MSRLTSCKTMKMDAISLIVNLELVNDSCQISVVFQNIFQKTVGWIQYDVWNDITIEMSANDLPLIVLWISCVLHPSLHRSTISSRLMLILINKYFVVSVCRRKSYEQFYYNIYVYILPLLPRHICLSDRIINMEKFSERFLTFFINLYKQHSKLFAKLYWIEIPNSDTLNERNVFYGYLV